jgi:hypothetical protein
MSHNVFVKAFASLLFSAAAPLLVSCANDEPQTTDSQDVSSKSPTEVPSNPDVNLDSIVKSNVAVSAEYKNGSFVTTFRVRLVPQINDAKRSYMVFHGETPGSDPYGCIKGDDFYVAYAGAISGPSSQYKNQNVCIEDGYERVVVELPGYVFYDVKCTIYGKRYGSGEITAEMKEKRNQFSEQLNEWRFLYNDYLTYVAYNPDVNKDAASRLEAKMQKVAEILDGFVTEDMVGEYMQKYKIIVNGTAYEVGSWTLTGF